MNIHYLFSKYLEDNKELSWKEITNKFNISKNRFLNIAIGKSRIDYEELLDFSKVLKIDPKYLNYLNKKDCKYIKEVEHLLRLSKYNVNVVIDYEKENVIFKCSCRCYINNICTCLNLECAISWQQIKYSNTKPYIICKEIDDSFYNKIHNKDYD